MKSKPFKSCVCVSMMFFLGFAGLYIYALIADPHPTMSRSSTSCPHVSFSDNFNVTVIKHWGGNVVFFNQEVPFFGGSFGQTESEKGWDGCGIYFRIVKDTRRADNWWTLMISLWYPIVIFCVLPLIFLIQKWRSAPKNLRSNLA